MTKFKGDFLLLITAIICGTAFVSQKLGMRYIDPFTFGAIRFLLGSIILVLVIALRKKIQSLKQPENYSGLAKTHQIKHLLVGGVICGTAFFIAASFLQFGIRYTSAGKAGFITTLYILLVPLLGLLLHKRVDRLVWLGIALSTAGLYLLCVKKGFSIEKGDLIIMVSTLFWAIHILAVDAYADKTDAIKLSCIQFATAAGLSTIAALTFESPELEAIIASAGPILYNSFVVIGIAFTFQIVGQKYTHPAHAALILSTESVFAAISGAVILNEALGIRELIGCILMFVAIIITQLDRILANFRMRTS